MAVKNKLPSEKQRNDIWSAFVGRFSNCLAAIINGTTLTRIQELEREVDVAKLSTAKLSSELRPEILAIVAALDWTLSAPKDEADSAKPGKIVAAVLEDARRLRSSISRLMRDIGPDVALVERDGRSLAGEITFDVLDGPWRRLQNVLDDVIAQNEPFVLLPSSVGAGWSPALCANLALELVLSAAGHKLHVQDQADLAGALFDSVIQRYRGDDLPRHRDLVSRAREIVKRTMDQK